MAMVVVTLITIIISKPSHDDGNEHFDEDHVSHLDHFDIFESTSFM
jgi:hypothetical protein